jgi:hypothetical protein
MRLPGGSAMAVGLVVWNLLDRSREFADNARPKGFLEQSIVMNGR